MSFKISSVLADRRPLSGNSVTSGERYLGLRNNSFWSGRESMKNFKSKQSEIGPPMTLLPGSRKRRSESLRNYPIINHNSEEKKLPPLNTPALLTLLPASELLRTPILRPHSSPLRCDRIKQIYNDIDFESVISSKFKSQPDSINHQKYYSLRPNCEAYFLSKPPIVPIRLIVTGPPTRNSRVQLFIKAMQQIELESTEHRRTSEKSSNKPLRWLSPTRPLHNQEKKQKNNTFRFVKCIVKDVIKNLPLCDDVPEQVTNGSKSSQIYGNNRKIKQHDCGDRSTKDSHGNFSDDCSRCSIAVQALIQQKSHTDVSEISKRGHSAHGKNDDWIGGVRALRDSHVRLVLRQLRHITCLNRALDRATKP